MAQGGDVLELRVNHPTLGSRVFFPKSGEDNNLDLGGFRNEDDANMVTASGEAIVKKNFVKGSLEIVLANDQKARLDSQFCGDLAASTEQGDWSFSVIDGSVYGAKGDIVGDITSNLNAATFSIKIAFGKVNKLA
tara:strand:+ start:1177 stop:1581 length:405 start_codon:yes stop_codon:yes gene_type:complete